MIKVFKYIPELDAFALTPEFQQVLDDLCLGEWGQGTSFIGRYLCMDNDFGEHFADNWDEREAIEDLAEKMGYDTEQLLIVCPDRFKDKRDGPCHSNEMRKKFWTDVFKSLELSLEFLVAEAEKNLAYWKDHCEISEDTERVKTMMENIPKYKESVALLGEDQ